MGLFSLSEAKPTPTRGPSSWRTSSTSSNRSASIESARAQPPNSRGSSPDSTVPRGWRPSRPVEGNPHGPHGTTPTAGPGGCRWPHRPGPLPPPRPSDMGRGTSVAWPASQSLDRPPPGESQLRSGRCPPRVSRRQAPDRGANRALSPLNRLVTQPSRTVVSRPQTQVTPRPAQCCDTRSSSLRVSDTLAVIVGERMAPNRATTPPTP